MKVITTIFLLFFMNLCNSRILLVTIRDERRKFFTDFRYRGKRVDE